MLKFNKNFILKDKIEKKIKNRKKKLKNVKELKN
jgi:hypothetical protein